MNTRNTSGASPKESDAMGAQQQTQAGGAGPEAPEGAAPATVNDPAGAALAEAMTQAAAGALPKGAALGLSVLRGAFDPNAVVLFTQFPRAGASKSRVEQWDHALVEIGDNRQIIIVQGNEDGSYRMFAEVKGRLGSDIVNELKRIYGHED